MTQSAWKTCRKGHCLTCQLPEKDRTHTTICIGQSLKRHVKALGCGQHQNTYTMNSNWFAAITKPLYRRLRPALYAMSIAQSLVP